MRVGRRELRSHEACVQTVPTRPPACLLSRGREQCQAGGFAAVRCGGRVVGSFLIPAMMVPALSLFVPLSSQS